MKQVQLIWAHPRTDSLTARVVENVKDELNAQGWYVTELDLYRAGFDPALGIEDEPDWSKPVKTYSRQVMELAEQLPGKQAAFIVFPIWWYSLPAMLKGYIDRVWNSGIAYGGGHNLPFKSVRWIALAGESEAQISKRGLDKSFMLTLNVGIAGYCGVKDSQVTLLYDTHAESTANWQAHHANLIKKARQIATDWAKAQANT